MKLACILASVMADGVHQLLQQRRAYFKQTDISGQQRT
jgi:hypothetical protein